MVFKFQNFLFSVMIKLLLRVLGRVIGKLNCHLDSIKLSAICWLVRGSLFIELGCPRDLGKGWRGDLGTFMISRPI